MTVNKCLLSSYCALGIGQGAGGAAIDIPDDRYPQDAFWRQKESELVTK